MSAASLILVSPSYVIIASYKDKARLTEPILMFSTSIDSYTLQCIYWAGRENHAHTVYGKTTFIMITWWKKYTAPMTVEIPRKNTTKKVKSS